MEPRDKHFFTKRLGAGVLSFVLLFSAVFGSFPQSAKAVWGVADIVYDPVNWIENALSTFFDGEINIKEFILDPLAYMAAREAIQSIMRSVINWANNGFEGSPAFITDLERNLQNLGDRIADVFIDELGISGFIDSPFREVVIRELRTSYRRATADNAYFERSRYTLDRYSDDPERFLRGDTSRGGIRAWIHTWMNPQNTPYGALRAARTELEERISRGRFERLTELGWSNGILSWCSPTPASTAEGEGGEGGEGEGSSTTSLSAPRNGCDPGEQRRTPGSFIHERIKRSLNVDLDSLVTADEIDEMIGAVLQGLVNKMMGGGGFSGLSEPSSGGGRSAVDEATDPSNATDGLTGGGSGSAIDGQIEQVERYLAAWQIIKSAAETAKTACTTGGDATLSQEVDGVLANATQKVSETQTLLSDMREIQFKLASGQNTLVQQGTTAYQALLQSNRIPSLEDSRYALEQSQDIANITPATLLMRMNTIAEDNCRP